MKKPQPPIARRQPILLEKHNHQRIDEYYWLRDEARCNPEVLCYLQEENQYAEAAMQNNMSLQERLYAEIRGRIQDEDMSVPYRLDDYWYYSRYKAGQEYPLHARKKHTLEDSEEVLLDVNALAQGHAFYNLEQYLVSPDHTMLACVEDTVGDRQYTIRIKDLREGVWYSERMEKVSNSLAWSWDGQYLFYVGIHPETLLPYQVFRHRLGTSVGSDVLIYEESDCAFYAYVCNSRSRNYIFLILGSTLSSEVRLLDAAMPEQEFRIFLSREENHEYEIEHIGKDFYVRSNWQAENFRLMKTSLTECEDKTKWSEVIPHSDSCFLEDFEVFDHYLAVNERSSGTLRIRVISLADERDDYIETESSGVSVLRLGHNPSPHTHCLHYEFSSMTMPDCMYEYNMANGKRVLLKQMSIPGGYDACAYQAERVWVEADDGAQIPVSLIYAKGLNRDGRAPLYLYAYGAYGISSDPHFSGSIISLLDRGFVYGIAHVRGGQELGRRWYDAGRLLHKKNTFTDFIAVTRALVELNYADPKKIIAGGGSAGGLLVAAVVNMQPKFYKAIIANVPFVDILTSMLDESMPLTTGEYDEWGDPKEKEFYDYIWSYSPYDQVCKQYYPHMLVMSGLYDSQVQYWEPAKWVAKLRANKTDDNLLLLRINMKTGHLGASGRYEWIRELAFEYAFILDILGLNDVSLAYSE